MNIIANILETMNSLRKQFQLNHLELISYAFNKNRRQGRRGQNLRRPRRGISMGQFYALRSVREKKRISRFRFQNSHLMRCTERPPDFWYFVYVPVRTFRYPNTACKVKPHHPFAVESETGTRRALMHAFPSDKSP